MNKLRIMLAVVLVTSALAACGMNKETTPNNANNNPAVEKEVDKNKGVGKDEQTNELDNGVDHNGESRLDLAEDAANKVTELDEVDNATVIITDNNAYVAVEMNNKVGNAENSDAENEVSQDLEKQIADKVREVKADTDQVYVSLNPDFVERMSDYGTRIKEGEPIEGFFDEFGEAMRNVFPDAR